MTAKSPVGQDALDPVRLYLDAAGEHPLLTRDDEVVLAQQIEDGSAALGLADDHGAALTPTERRAIQRRIRKGRDAHLTFVLANLRLVVSIAKRYRASGVPLLDLIQEGNLGLIHAVDKFDHRRGFKFSTYATWWIRQSIARGIANTGRVVRLPVYAGDLRLRLLRTMSQLEMNLGRSPTHAELATEMELPVEKVRETLRIAADPVSLDQPVGEDGDAVLGDVVHDRSALAPDDLALASLLPDEVRDMLSCLDPRERRVLELRYGLDRGEPRTLEEVGVLFGLTRERIRQIETRALARLREPAICDQAADLLDA